MTGGEGESKKNPLHEEGEGRPVIGGVFKKFEAVHRKERKGKRALLTEKGEGREKITLGKRSFRAGKRKERVLSVREKGVAFQIPDLGRPSFRR